MNSHSSVTQAVDSDEIVPYIGKEISISQKVIKYNKI